MDAAVPLCRWCCALPHLPCPPPPPHRYLVGSSATVQVVLRRLLPDSWWDRIVNAKLKQ